MILETHTHGDKRKTNNQKAIKRLPPEKAARNFKVAAFDIETDGLLGNFIYATYYHEDDEQPIGFTDIGDAIRHMVDRERATGPKFSGTRTYIHNASFDLRYMLEELKIIENSEIYPQERAEGCVYKVDCRDKVTKYNILSFYDSSAVYTGTLAEFSKAFGGEYVKKTHDHHKLFDPNNPDDVAYAKMDVRCLVESVINLDDKVYENFGVHLKGTAASTSFAGFQRKIPEGVTLYKQECKQAEGYERAAYFGGLVTMNLIPGMEMEEVYVFDLRSSYPSNLKRDYPDGKPFKVDHFVATKLGFYKVNCVVADDFILPTLPTRGQFGIVYHTGEFLTYMASPEIHYLNTLKGIKITVIDGYCYPRACRPFDEFVNLCERLRNEYADKKDKASEYVIKLMQNSLYGKFGTKPTGKREILHNTDGIPTEKGWLLLLDMKGDVIDDFYVRPMTIDAPYMIPAIAALCTSYARTLLNTLIDVAGRANVHYTDTDSIHTNPIGFEALISHPGAVGPRYGQLACESMTKGDGFVWFKAERFIYLAPKVYENLSNGKQKIKGLQAAVKKARAEGKDVSLAALRGVKLEYDSVSSFSSFLKTGSYGCVRRREISNPVNVVSHSIDPLTGRYRGVHTTLNANENDSHSQYEPIDMAALCAPVDPDDTYGHGLGFDEDLPPSKPKISARMKALFELFDVEAA